MQFALYSLGTETNNYPKYFLKSMVFQHFKGEKFIINEYFC